MRSCFRERLIISTDLDISDSSINDSMSASLIDRITVILLEKKELELRLDGADHPAATDIRKVT